MTMLMILRPKLGTRAAQLIDPGSGVVTDLLDAAVPSVLVYYEGNRYGAVNLQTLEDRVRSAAGRCVARYPTVARALLPRTDFDVIGTVDPADWSVTWTS
jgi:hypothetical protein